MSIGLLNHVRQQILVRALDTAQANGESLDRTLEQMRFHAGTVAGLREAAAIIEQCVKRNDEED